MKAPDVKRRPDAVSLILGLLTTALALAALWLSLGGSVEWSTLKVAAPLTLVVIGIIGLAASRSRSDQ
ncbi:hypothetical protein [Microlunatus soli]|uniref:Uncharacterized protein n=1 Tax=Microlunatus soli TaxID=630515 RepID=A0A1H1X1D8_9ACTN|nr:hypothetical protein [Microlunatus soli]SDT02359.1 hypothetical protein SAMN04489812_3867 [Microlunatus soli]